MMAVKGLVKLVEEICELTKELGELGQTVAKKIAYPDTDEHPDGKGSLKDRLEAEMGDVKGAIDFVAMKLGLDVKRIEARAVKKYNKFKDWDEQR